MKDRNVPMYNMPYNQPYPFIPGDIDNRLNSLERSVKRLEGRVSKLEGNTGMYSNMMPEYNSSLDMYNQNQIPNTMHMM